MYGAELSEIYEHVYELRGKDYQDESAYLAAVIRARNPQASTLLDVACGTGGHLRFLRSLFTHVEGLELSEPMLAVARDRVPDVPLHQGDMRDFRLDRRFDVVTCLFTAIAHLWTEAELKAGLESFARHLSPGGMVVFDPWWFPDKLIEGYISADVLTPDGTTIARMSHTTRDGDASRLEVHYLTATEKSGIRYFTEVYHHTLFTREQYEQGLRAAGFRPEYIGGVQHGRGLYVGVLET